ncbi:MAG: SipW-dependent-type signal peptide-containing protein [Candidatus Methanomethylophilaceae archaeon]|nr:SipW-dependent-type signal peptide-containing protein [Candidatus Methanomethylophilaceae archaeon]
MKAQTKAILASLVVIAVALSAVSGVTYSWWSDSENTDITVGTGALDVEILGDIRYSSAEGASGFFTVDEASVKSGTTSSLKLITGLTNVAPNDVYYIDYFVQYQTTVLAKYLTFVGDSVPWIDVSIEKYDGDTTVLEGFVTPNEDELTRMQWTDIPSDGSVESGITYVANQYVRVTITIADDAPMNTDDGYVPAVIEIVNEITQKANDAGAFNDNGSASVTATDNTVYGNIPYGDDTVPLRATFYGLGNDTYTFTASADASADAVSGSYGIDALVLSFGLKDSAGADATFDSVVIEVTMPGTIDAPIVFEGPYAEGETADTDGTNDPSDVYVNGNTVHFTAYHFSKYTVVDTAIDVKNDDELSAALGVIKDWNVLWNIPVTINLAAETYNENHEIYQYPEWNGVVGAGGSDNNMSDLAEDEDCTKLTFVGVEGVVMTGELTINGFGNGENGFGKAVNAYTKFIGIDFKGDDSRTYIINVTNASSEVFFEDCSFTEGNFVNLGNSNHGKTGFTHFDACVIEACLSGCFAGLEVKNSEVTIGAEAEGFANAQTASTIFILDCEISVQHDEGDADKDKYVFRTNSQVTITVTGGSIETNGHLQVVRGSNVTITYDGCNLECDSLYYEVGSPDNVTVTIDGVPYVFNQEQLQAALDSAVDEGVIALGADITGDVTVTQKAGVKITVDGNGKTFAGVLTVDGKSATYTTAGLTIKNVNFNAESINADACIRLGNGTNATRYTCNVTVEGCTFDVPGAVGIKSYTGGDKNLTIKNCTATSKAHSLVQAKGIDGILVDNCTVKSKNGLNFNNSDNVTVQNCTVDVKGYAVRFGESSGGAGAAETYLIKDCTLKSDNDDGDAVIILRGTADNSTLTIENTTISGTPDITNTAAGATVVR